MTSRVSLSIVDDLLPIDLAKVDAILLVMPAGKLERGNSWVDFFMCFGAFLINLAVVLELLDIRWSKPCSSSSLGPPSCCSPRYIASAEECPN